MSAEGRSFFGFARFFAGTAVVPLLEPLVQRPPRGVPRGPAGEHARGARPARSRTARRATPVSSGSTARTAATGAIPSVAPAKTSTGAVIADSEHGRGRRCRRCPTRARCPSRTGGRAARSCGRGRRSCSAVNRSTASTWARKSASSRWVATASGLVTSFWNDESWNAQRTSGVGAPPAAGRPGHQAGPGQAEQRAQRRHQRHLGHVDRRAEHRQRRDRQVGRVGGREHREDPAEAPADHVHRPAAGVLGHGPRPRPGTTLSTQCSSPRSRLRNETAPYSTRYVGRPPSTRCSTSEQPRRRSKQIAGAASGVDQQDRVARRPAVPAAGSVVVDLAQRGPSSIRVRGIGRRSARPPYSSRCATFPAAETTWSGFGTRSMPRHYPAIRQGR